VNQLVCRFDLIASDMGDFIIQLIDLIDRYRTSFTRADQIYYNKTIEFVKMKVTTIVEQESLSFSDQKNHLNVLKLLDKLKSIELQ
jgi:hypothetical protein